jgi:nucleoid DNA-binding protein
LIKQDIVHHVIERTGLPRTKAEAAVDTVFEGLKQALAAGERIELRGFGVFSVRARKTGIGRNPRTGTEVSITPGKAVRFKPGKETVLIPDCLPAALVRLALHPRELALYLGFLLDLESQAGHFRRLR